MNKLKTLCMAMLVMPFTVMAQHTLTLDGKAKGKEIQPTMYGIFFEDINFGADGGLYAELVENRSFEYPNHLMGWQTFGKVAIDDYEPAFNRNPHYATLSPSGHEAKLTGLENHGYFGIGLKKDMNYNFTVYARLNHLQGKKAKLQIDLVDDANNVIGTDSVIITNNRWAKHTATIKASDDAAHGAMRLTLKGNEPIDIDHVSLMPDDNWHGLRADLVKDLEDLHPGVFRFPGGCITEGVDLATRYQWKNTVGPVENRPLNENRWRDCTESRLFPNYYQSYGLGFYELFLLSEKIGADPLPILSCGLACQFQNSDDDPNAHVALADLQPFIDDALDLIEFANGDTTTTWGKLRAQMGHPKPFGLKQIGIGNEQWGQLYPERLEKFVAQIRARYPKIKIVGSSGPFSDGEYFDDGWREMRHIGVDLVDEHYYKSPEWFLANAKRYDGYSRKGPKVFAGEYASHNKNRKNDWRAALAEACFMTGLERNADVVYQATYAPLFAHVDGWQWRPDLIWYDNLRSVRTPNWQIQALYGNNKGSKVLPLTLDGKPVTGQDSIYATAAFDNNDKGYIIKIGNANSQPREITVNVKGVSNLSGVKALIITAPIDAENTLANPTAVVPKPFSVSTANNSISMALPAYSFIVIRTNQPN